MEVIIKRSPKFVPLYELPADVGLVVCIGGRGGMKTYEVSKFAASEIALKGKRVQVLRDELVSIKESIMNEILTRYDTANRDGVFNKSFSRLDNGIKNLKTGEMALFSKGFRASTLDKKANMKAVSNVDIGIIEEFEDIRNEDHYNTYSDSIRKEGSFIIILLNTPDIHHFLIKRYFNCIPVTVEDEPNFTEKELEGYFKLVPKDIKGFVCIQTNFRDNPHLPERIVRQYEAHGQRDPETGVVNSLHYYLNQIQGYCTTGLKGQIFKNYDICSLDDYMALPYEEIFGVDFGTASPAGIVSVKIHKNDIWVRQLNYEPLDLIGMGKKLDRLGIRRNDLVICDCAGRDFIMELRGGLKRYFTDEERQMYPQASSGFRALIGSPDKKIETGIEKLLSMKIHVTADSLDLQKELMMYVWDTDRDGKALDKPIKAYDHLIDPIRYIVIGYRGWKGN